MTSLLLKISPGKKLERHKSQENLKVTRENQNYKARQLKDQICNTKEILNNFLKPIIMYKTSIINLRIIILSIVLLLTSYHVNAKNTSFVL